MVTACLMAYSATRRSRRGFAQIRRLWARHCRAVVTAELRQGAVARPTLAELWNAVLEFLELDAIAFDLRPRAASHVHAKRLLMWLWVREYEGKQIEVARLLGITTASASALYAQTVAAAAEFDQEGSVVAARLAARQRRKRLGSTKLNAQVVRVRYHVDVEGE